MPIELDKLGLLAFTRVYLRLLTITHSQGRAEEKYAAADGYEEETQLPSLLQCDFQTMPKPDAPPEPVIRTR